MHVHLQYNTNAHMHSYVDDLERKCRQAGTDCANRSITIATASADSYTICMQARLFPLFKHSC